MMLNLSMLKTILMTLLFSVLGLLISCSLFDSDCSKPSTFKEGKYQIDLNWCTLPDGYPPIENATATVFSDKVIVEFESEDIVWELNYEILKWR